MAKEKPTHSVCEVVVKQIDAAAFPLDMLRYDSCVPATETDASIIRNTIEEEGRRLLKNVGWSGYVVLRRFYEGGATQRASLNIARWRSQGWEVVRVYLPGESGRDVVRYDKDVLHGPR